MVISALMIEGADRARVRLGGWGGAGGGTGTSFLLENMAAGLDEVGGIPGDVIVPDFIMDMRPGAAAGRAHPAQIGALVHPCTGAHADGGEMAVAGVDAIAMVDFHHIAIAAA